MTWLHCPVKAISMIQNRHPLTGTPHQHDLIRPSTNLRHHERERAVPTWETTWAMPLQKWLPAHSEGHQNQAPALTPRLRDLMPSTQMIWQGRPQRSPRNLENEFVFTDLHRTTRPHQTFRHHSRYWWNEKKYFAQSFTEEHLLTDRRPSQPISHRTFLRLERLLTWISDCANRPDKLNAIKNPFKLSLCAVHRHTTDSTFCCTLYKDTHTEICTARSQQIHHRKICTLQKLVVEFMQTKLHTAHNTNTSDLTYYAPEKPTQPDEMSNSFAHAREGVNNNSLILLQLIPLVSKHTGARHIVSFDQLRGAPNSSPSSRWPTSPISSRSTWLRRKVNHLQHVLLQTTLPTPHLQRAVHAKVLFMRPNTPKLCEYLTKRTEKEGPLRAFTDNLPAQQGAH